MALSRAGDDPLSDNGEEGRPSSGPRSSSPDSLTRRFRPLFVVGRGGMGSIEVAIERAEDGTEHIVALKRMLPSSVRDKRLTEMFLREAKLASLLDHPNVVHATSFGERDGALFLVMEYIEGEPLSRVVAMAHERGVSLALPLVAHILAEICEGLHAAHELTDETGRPLNVVHRDVSPQNVMVSYDGHAKLLDFGVAKIEALEAEGKTKTGEVKGKTSYMSPEQAMGDPIDRRSDLYSVGAVLFEAVSGRKMWGGGTDLEVLRRMALEEPPRLEDVAPGTPELICRLQRRLVARDPDKRPSTSEEVAKELRTFIASTGTHPDAHVLRSLMTGLFSTEIERRRAALKSALEEVAPSNAEVLHASLPALPPSDATPVAATRGLRASGTWPRSTRTLATAGAALVAVAVAAALVWRSSPPPASGTLSGSAPTAGASAERPAPVASTASAPANVPTPPASAAPSSPAAPPPATAARQKAPPAPALPDTSSKPRLRDKPRVPPPSKSAGPLDVDPAPF
jgi:serine/threonine protein kinase